MEVSYNNFSLKVIQNFCKQIKNLEYRDFKKMYIETELENIEADIQYEYIQKNNYFVEWFSSLSENKIRKMIEWIEVNKPGDNNER